MPHRRILCVGLCCLDVFNVCSDYPKEDSDERTLEHYWQRGGNASNMCTTLSLLGADCELFATFARSNEQRYIEDDLSRHNIDHSNCVIHDCDATPVATVILNAKNGSRTILFSKKDLPELRFEDFEKIDLSNSYRWIHFETRPICDDISRMIERIRSFNESRDTGEKITISLELEKPARHEFVSLIDKVDVVFVSKDFAQCCGYSDMEVAVQGFKDKSNQTTVICAWADKGAAALSDQLVTSPSYPPDKIVDTLGAGDVFNATVIHALVSGKTLAESISFGCQVAGRKIGSRGYSHIGDMFL